MKKLAVISETKQRQRKLQRKTTAVISYSDDTFGAFIQLWKDILKSNLHPKDKAEIMRLLIFAFTIIVIISLFVLNHF